MTALVQGPVEQADSSPSATVSKTFASDVTAGNLIAVVVRGIDTSSPRAASTFSITVADTLGNAYTQAVATTTQYAALDEEMAAIFYAKNISGGACTVTATFDRAADRYAITLYEVSGLDTAVPLEDTNSGTGTSTAPSSGSVTSAGGGFILAAAINDNNFDTISAGTGWTSDSTSVLWDYALYEHRIEAAAGTFTGDFTQASSGAWAAIVAAFKIAGGGGGGSFQPAWASNSTITISSGARGA